MTSVGLEIPHMAWRKSIVSAVWYLTLSASVLSCMAIALGNVLYLLEQFTCSNHSPGTGFRERVIEK